MSELSPIILFVYNRPQHTRRTLQALEKNVLASESILYIYSDGAKTAEDVDTVNEVRTIIREPLAFSKIEIIERKKNYGLANNVIGAVSEIIEKHGTAIVLEDDVILMEHTLSYFNDALVKYKTDEKVMHIGSYMYNIDSSNLPETFFTRHISSQAWATWDRSWKYLNPNIDQLIKQFDKQKIKEFTFDHTMNFWKQMLLQQKGTIDSWAIRWYASVFLQGGLGLQCSLSLIQNIGHDGSGVHSDISNLFDSPIKEDKVNSFPEKIEENKEGYIALRNYFKNRKGSLWQRGMRFLRNKVSPS